jgi:hypothetical protein
MHHFATALYAGVTATVLIGGAVLTSTPVEAARTSNVEKVALKETTAACKAEAKEKKISWPASRKFVNDCVAKAVKLTPTMNIREVRRGVNVKTLRVQQRPEWGCEGMTSGRATGC